MVKDVTIPDPLSICWSLYMLTFACHFICSHLPTDPSVTSDKLWSWHFPTDAW